MAEAPRRFPPPWRVDQIPGGYVVRDANGQALAYLYSRDSEADARQAKVLTADEADRAQHCAVAGASRKGRAGLVPLHSGYDSLAEGDLAPIGSG
jgi:hypothetical protein